ncbi:MAG: flagellar export chaperone FliS [Planctomycetes bacterium]|nr:flagellar export chaperone FliS [Planctomycetota bacterium]
MSYPVSKNARDSYLRERVMKASPGELVVMMYDGAIQALQGAKGCGENLAKYTELLTKAQKIVAELASSLKPEKDPVVSKNLLALYDYIYSRLVQICLEGTVEEIDEVINLLVSLKDSWNEALIKAKKEGTLPERAFTNVKETRSSHFTLQA